MKSRKLTKQLMVLGICILLSTICYPVHAADQLPVGSTLPEFSVALPESPEVQEYLGIKDVKTFSVPQIQAKLVVLEFFSPFCPVCQQQAPIANKVYKFIQDDSELSKDVKMIGISLESNDYALNVYKKNFKVQFPLLLDSSKEVQEKSSVEKIPHTVVIDKKGKVLISHLGKIDKTEEFLHEIRKFHKQQ